MLDIIVSSVAIFAIVSIFSILLIEAEILDIKRSKKRKI